MGNPVGAHVTAQTRLGEATVTIRSGLRAGLVLIAVVRREGDAGALVGRVDGDEAGAGHCRADLHLGSGPFTRPASPAAVRRQLQSEAARYRRESKRGGPIGEPGQGQLVTSPGTAPRIPPFVDIDQMWKGEAITLQRLHATSSTASAAGRSSPLPTSPG